MPISEPILATKVTRGRRFSQRRSQGFRSSCIWRRVSGQWAAEVSMNRSGPIFKDDNYIVSKRRQHDTQ